MTRQPDQIASRRPARWLPLLFCFTALLHGCIFSETLFSQLPEQEANNIVALLHTNNIPAQKVNKGKGLYSITLSASHFAHAVQITRQWGFPRQKTMDLASLFQTSGLVPTPMEEQVRYINGLTKELETTISQIEGINHVKVHISIASVLRSTNNTSRLLDQTKQKTEGSKAAVLIKYEPDKLLPNIILSRITRLVSDSVPLLEDDNIAILPVPDISPFAAATDESLVLTDFYVIGSVRIRHVDFPLVAGSLASLIIICIVLAGLNSVLFLRRSGN